MVVPAVAISTLLGALDSCVLMKWHFKGDTILFGFMLFVCFVPFQIVLVPMARILRIAGFRADADLRTNEVVEFAIKSDKAIPPKRQPD